MRIYLVKIVKKPSLFNDTLLSVCMTNIQCRVQWYLKYAQESKNIDGAMIAWNQSEWDSIIVRLFNDQLLGDVVGNKLIPLVFCLSVIRKKGLLVYLIHAYRM